MAVGLLRIVSLSLIFSYSSLGFTVSFSHPPPYLSFLSLFFILLKSALCRIVDKVGWDVSTSRSNNQWHLKYTAACEALGLCAYENNRKCFRATLPTSAWSLAFMLNGSDGSWGRYHGERRSSTDNRFHSPTVIPPSALDKPSIMKRYHRRRTTR